MKQDLLNNECLVVADRDYYQLLYKFKNDHPSIDLKIISPNELIDRLSFTYNEDIIPTLISNGIEYSKAKKYESLFRVADIENNDKLKKVFSYISSSIIKKDIYGVLELSKKKVYLFEMDADVELRHILNKNNIPFESLSFEDLDIPNQETYKNTQVQYFSNKYYQYLYIFSDIRRRILEDESIKNNIRILVKDDSDIFYINAFSKTFDIPCYASVSTPMNTDKDIKNKLERIYNSKSFVFTEEELTKDSLISLYNIINKYGLNCLGEDKFSFAYSNLLEIVASNSFLSFIDNKGIIITNKFMFNDSYITYVTCFEHGQFYKVFDDDNVISDKDLVKVNANTSYVRTNLDKQKKLNYLKHNNIVLLSRVKQHLSENIYDSQFLSEDDKKKIKTIDINEAGIYTELAKKIMLRNEYDNNSFKDEDFINENTYKNDFKGLDKDKSILPFLNRKPDVYSVTKLESYVSCPFRFYLTTVLPSDESDMHARWRGVLTHKVFESINHKDYDFEKAFQEGVEDYKAEVAKAGEEFTNKEEAYIEIMHHWLANIVPIYLDSYRSIKIIENKNDAEQKVLYSFEDESGKTYKFSGRIDKLIWSEFADKKFYTIVDYKSGGEEFIPSRVFLGTSTQLPLYYYAIESSNQHLKGSDESIFGGFGIQHNYFSSIKNAFNGSSVLNPDNNKAASRIHGLTIDDPDYYHSIDETAFKKDGSILANGGDLIQRKKKIVFNDVNGEENVSGIDGEFVYNVNMMIEDAKKATIQTIKNIENNDFAIAPADFSGSGRTDNLPCGYCQYRDVCFRKKADIKNMKKLILEKFQGIVGDEDNSDDEEESDDE